MRLNFKNRCRWSTSTTVAAGAALVALAIPFTASASGGGGHASHFPLQFLFIVIALLAGRIGALVERVGQPAVLGELMMGLLLSALAFIPWLHGIRTMSQDLLLVGVAEIGVILLLFQTGMESDIQEMKKVGLPAFLVAILGVVLPFAGGYFAGKALIPGLETNAYIFIGAVLTATSVGITARVFKDLGVLKLRESQIVLGAAVIDDVLGLIILAVVSGIVSAGTIALSTVGLLFLKALVFLAGAILLGKLLAPRLGRWFSSIHAGVGMKMALALIICALFAWAAEALAGLAPIVGAFAAGLVLDPVHFARFRQPQIARQLKAWANTIASAQVPRKEFREVCGEMREHAHAAEHQHVENLIEGVSRFFVPIFFVYTGLQVNLSVFGDLQTVTIALALTAVAIIGKVVAGYAAGKGMDHKLIGVGMVPRGEVGLIFANVGRQLGVVNDQVFAVIVVVVILTTMITPPVLNLLVKRQKAATK
jgi:Kef-type K+ transport system membrane component KefB